LDVTARVNNEHKLSTHAAELEVMTTELTKFRLAVENASDVILITDSDGFIVFASKAVGKVFGYTSKEMLGEPPSFWIHNMKPAFYKKVWKTIKAEEASFSGEMLSKRKNGTIFPAEVHISAVPHIENGKPQFYVSIVRDITEQKRTDQAKTEFISLTAHQLRTPLTTIGLTAELLLRDIAGELNATGRKYLRSINDDITYMSRLIGVFLDVSRLELGVFEVHPVLIDPIKLINKVLDEVKSSILKKEIKLETLFGKKLPKISLDKNVMNIVLENILSNAVKYTPERGSIKVSLERGKKDLLFTVADNGCGIPKADQEHVFAKLYRAANVRDGGSDGIGLGLYLAKNLTEKTGGKLYFTSEENKGSTFYISIPLSGMTEKKIRTFDF
jgi:two-component system sensor histidine kinase VicK